MKSTRSISALVVVVLLVGFSLAQFHSASAGPQTITVYKSQHPVTLDGVVEAGEWNDTPMFTEPTSGMTAAFKQNGTGLLFLLQWTESSPYCTDSACFGGIELGRLNNTGEMGTPLTPTIMILTSTSFKGNVDEFISAGDTTPETVESQGYATQSVCGLTLSSQQYTAECYRPFKLTNPSPYDVNLAVGSTVEIAFAVGEFSSPGDHLASDMSTYLLTVTDQVYTPSTTTTTSTGTGITNSASTTAFNTTSTSSAATSSVVSSAPAFVSTYAEEFAVMVVGFSVLILVALMKYRRS